jgi:hypothetical protein
MTRGRPVHLQIDELVLAGFSAAERHRIRDAVERALVEMIERGALPILPAATSRSIEAMPLQNVRLRGAATPATIGAGVAGSIVGAVASATNPGLGEGS